MRYLAVGPFAVTVDALGMTPRQAIRTVGGGTAPMRREGGKIRVTIDNIVDHEMLVIE